MSFRRYDSYKDSGVQWLGRIPTGWGVRRIRHLFEIRKRICGSEGYEVLSITQQGIKAKDIESGDGQLSTDYSKYQFVQIGDFAMNHMDLLTGYVDISPMFGVTSPDYRVFAARDNELCFDRYYLYLFQAGYRSKIFYAFGQGSSQLGRWRFPTDEFKSFEVPWPPIEEQRQIAAFLDRETAKIDVLVTEQQRLIDILKEKRRGIASHAVTKGLNRLAPMNDSGIEWLGAIPEHWEITRLGWICSQINDINHEMPSAVEKGVPFLSAKDLLDDGTLNFTTDVKMISEEDFGKLSSKICPTRGDIIYSRIGACLGKARLVETDDRFLISYSCCVVRVIPEIASRRFIRHLLDGEMILSEARMRTQGIGVPDLGLREIGRFPVPLPPMTEQEAIAEFLDDATGKLGDLIAEAQRGIGLLQERRMALIADAVTGKIDVRGLPSGQREAGAAA